MDNQIKKSKAPMILGIISCIAWLIPLIGIVTSIVGIVLSAKKIKEYSCKAYKIALTLNIIGLVITIVYFIINFIILYKQLVA